MKYLTLIILALVLIACQSKEKNQHTPTAVHSADLPIYTEKSVAKIEIVQAEENFQKFWDRFRRATLALDSSQIIAMTKFPFMAKGPLDDDPVIKYNSEKFFPVFRTFLNQWDGLSLEGSTELDVIRRCLTVDSKEVQDKYTRVADLVFARFGKEGWKLTFVYLNNETLDSLAK